MAWYKCTQPNCLHEFQSPSSPPWISCVMCLSPVMEISRPIKQKAAPETASGNRPEQYNSNLKIGK